MSIVNFSIPAALERRVTETIQQKGLTSKAEFFRFAALHFLEVIEKPAISEEERFAFLTKALRAEIKSRFRGKKLPSLKEQLSDI